MVTTQRTLVVAIARAARGAVAALLACACGHAGTADTYEPRASNCQIQVLPNAPRSGYVEVGELSFEAYAAGPAGYQYKSPYALAADLRPQICAVGGDTLVTERNAAGVIVRGTVYRRAEMRDVAPPPPRDQLPSRAEVCEPACGPGQTCEGGTCIAACVPPCAEGETCGGDLRCHPAR